MVWYKTGRHLGFNNLFIYGKDNTYRRKTNKAINVQKFFKSNIKEDILNDGLLYSTFLSRALSAYLFHRLGSAPED